MAEDIEIFFVFRNGISMSICSAVFMKYPEIDDGGSGPKHRQPPQAHHSLYSSHVIWMIRMESHLHPQTLLPQPLHVSLLYFLVVIHTRATTSLLTS